MSFLYCDPIIFVINDEYEVLVLTKENGIIYIEIDGVNYYENNSGVLSSEKNYAKIRIPQKVLNKYKKYGVVYKKTIKRKAYFSKMGNILKENYIFKPLVKENNINIYHIADVHYRFNIAKKTASYFGDELDLLIVNGDIGEVETLQNYYDVIKFVADISKGLVPVVFSRGNHDTRGRLAERFADFFPANNKKTYYSFDLGFLSGVVLDCGEDKVDSHEEYGGVNVFERFRENETLFLKELPKKNTLSFAVSHICPSQTTQCKDDIFNIEKETYMTWNKELDRLGIKFMICAHIHKAYILYPHSKESTIDHNYPVIVGSACYEHDIVGTAISIIDNKLVVRFTDSNGNIKEENIIEL